MVGKITPVSVEKGFAKYRKENPEIRFSTPNICATPNTPAYSGFDVVDKGTVHHFVAAGRGVVSRKIPVAGVVG